MTELAVVLYTLALLAQIAGGALVVGEVIRTQWNVRKFKDDLDQADQTRRDHRERMVSGFSAYKQKASSPESRLAIQYDYRVSAVNNLVHQIYSPESIDSFADIGLASAQQRHAMRDLLTREFPEQSRKLSAPWCGACFLFLGIGFSYVASLVALT